AILSFQLQRRSTGQLNRSDTAYNSENPSIPRSLGARAFAALQEETEKTLRQAMEKGQSPVREAPQSPTLSRISIHRATAPIIQSIKPLELHKINNNNTN